MKKTISILIAVVLLFSTVSYATSSLNDAKNKAQNELSGVRAERTDIEAQINRINTEISKYESEIAELSENIIKLNAEIEEATIKWEKAKKRYEETEKLFVDRMVALYEAGETSYLDVLLSSSSLTDFISNYFLISELAEYDTQLLNEIERERNSLEIAKTELENKQATLEVTRDNKQATQTSLQASKDTKNSYINVLNSKEDDLKAKIAQYDKDIQTVEAEIARQSGNNSGPYTGGQMGWPAPGYYSISSPYGMRLHPILGVYRMHTGIDIAAPSGVNIVAANDGTVALATYDSGYGNYILINHGGGYSTLYAHSSQLLVSAGQAVTRGQTIAKVGSTGMSTGAHLHFEVRINGSTTDPVPYLK